MEGARELTEKLYDEIASGESITSAMGKVIEEEKRRMLDEYAEYMRKKQSEGNDD